MYQRYLLIIVKELIHIDKILTSVAICFCESLKAVNFSAAATESVRIFFGVAGPAECLLEALRRYG